MIRSLNMFIRRHLSKQLDHFKNKLVFISGPRQTGKTSLVEHDLKPGLILNMDIAADRLTFKQFPNSILSWYESTIGPFPKLPTGAPKPLVFLDEIHKVKGWRTLIKGTFDKTHHAIRYVASGSSAFELRRQDKGDSLAGRAIWLQLHPISFREYITTLAPDIALPSAWTAQEPLVTKLRQIVPYQTRLRALWDTYSRFGSFPEPLVNEDPVFYDQWLRDYLAAMLDRDLKDLHVAKDVERVYHVFELLLEGLGSTYSLRSLAETLSVSPNTIKSDIRALKQILWGIELPCAQISAVKQIRKEKKFYPMDFSLVRYREPLASGAPFECTVACLLFRTLSSRLSGPLPPLQLGFYRDYTGREVDFIVKEGRKTLLALECKRKAKQGTGHLTYIANFTPQESILAVEEAGIFECTASICIASIEYLAACLE